MKTISLHVAITKVHQRVPKGKASGTILWWIVTITCTILCPQLPGICPFPLLLLNSTAGRTCREVDREADLAGQLTSLVLPCGRAQCWAATVHLAALRYEKSQLQQMSKQQLPKCLSVALIFIYWLMWSDISDIN